MAGSAGGASAAAAALMGPGSTATRAKADPKGKAQGRSLRLAFLKVCGNSSLPQ